MNTNTLRLQRKIMRRVYYAFTLRILKNPMTIEVTLFTVALLVFAHLVHVHRIISTLLDMPLRNVPRYVFNAFVNGEMLTLIAIGVMVFAALSFPLHLRQLYVPKFRRELTA